MQSRVAAKTRASTTSKFFAQWQSRPAADHCGQCRPCIFCIHRSALFYEECHHQQHYHGWQSVQKHPFCLSSVLLSRTSLSCLLCKIMSHSDQHCLGPLQENPFCCFLLSHCKGSSLQKILEQLRRGVKVVYMKMMSLPLIIFHEIFYNSACQAFLYIASFLAIVDLKVTTVP